MTHIRQVAAVSAWLLALAATAVVLAVSTRPLVSRLSEAAAGPDAVVAATAAVAGWAVLARLVAGLALSLAEVLLASMVAAGAGPVSRLAVAVTPTSVRAAVHTSLRAGLVLGVLTAPIAVPATAATGPSAYRAVDDSRAAPVPSLDRPAHPVDQPRSRDVRSGARPDRYRVRAGDTLWHIAARHLPATAGDPEVARAWPRWWQANRRIIGSDPGLIRPGQVLRAPEARS